MPLSASTTPSISKVIQATARSPAGGDGTASSRTIDSPGARAGTWPSSGSELRRAGEVGIVASGAQPARSADPAGQAVVPVFVSRGRSAGRIVDGRRPRRADRCRPRPPECDAGRPARDLEIDAGPEAPRLGEPGDQRVESTRRQSRPGHRRVASRSASAARDMEPDLRQDAGHQDPATWLARVAGRGGRGNHVVVHRVDAAVLPLVRRPARRARPRPRPGPRSPGARQWGTPHEVSSVQYVSVPATSMTTPFSVNELMWTLSRTSARARLTRSMWADSSSRVRVDSGTPGPNPDLTVAVHVAERVAVAPELGIVVPGQGDVRITGHDHGHALGLEPLAEGERDGQGQRLLGSLDRVVVRVRHAPIEAPAMSGIDGDHDRARGWGRRSGCSSRGPG